MFARATAVICIVELRKSARATGTGVSDRAMTADGEAIGTGINTAWRGKSVDARKVYLWRSIVLFFFFPHHKLLPFCSTSGPIIRHAVEVPLC